MSVRVWRLSSWFIWEPVEGRGWVVTEWDPRRGINREVLRWHARYETRASAELHAMEMCEVCVR